MVENLSVSQQMGEWTKPNPHSLILRFWKRTFDITFSLLGLLFLWPIFAFIAIRIRRDSPGPVYYHGPRVGRYEKIFRIHKFRTMYETPESYKGSTITSNGDDRVTKLGAWLRDSKLNELPQLWNILRGEMSFVGPRPEHPDIAATWSEELRQEIFSVRPGLTSPASVTYRDEEKMLSSSRVMDDYLKKIMPDKQRLDQLYIRHFSLAGDLDVIFMTLTMLLPGLRNKKLPETVLFEGPFTSFLKKYVTWFMIDTIVGFIAFSVVTLLWRATNPLDIGFVRMLLIAAFLSLILAITTSLLGLRRVNWRYASPTHVVDIALSTSIAILVFSLLVINTLKVKVPIPLIIEFGIFCFFGFVAIRYRERLITGLASRWIRWRAQTNAIGERVVVIGGGDCGQLAIWLLEKSNLSSAFSIIGIVDDDFAKQNQRINGYPVIGTVRDLPELVRQKSIGVVMFAISKISARDRETILQTVRSLPVNVIMIPDLLTVVSEYFTKQAKKAEDLTHG